ncbi:hypothetical protein WICMUC_003589 [Wickerhamomyces mucosus]|uniref:Uncharacterized protein n=1 Tax=Wickerhamomyces mucosus TaxID=1378264 RepID=A0A9P8PK54_9ASCO|nr:hypothetical protein WICMUC_003589 [Wickerhamomyces mucosus]
MFDELSPPNPISFGMKSLEDETPILKQGCLNSLKVSSPISDSMNSGLTEGYPIDSEVLANEFVQSILEIIEITLVQVS